jgi:hypothetical protein
MFSLFYNVIVLCELSIGPPWLERETQIHESPIPVPTGTTNNPQAKKIKKILIKSIEVKARTGDNTGDGDRTSQMTRTEIR